MTSVKPYPLSPYPTRAKAVAVRTFPWVIFLVCWLLFFLMENKLDAPLNPALEDRPISEVAQQSSEGDSLHKILTVALGAIGALLCFQNRQRLSSRGWMTGLLGAYLAWICIGVFVADDPDLTVRRIGGYVLSLVFCAGCAARIDAGKNALFVAGIPALTLIPDVFSELRYRGFAALSDRFGGTYPHANVAAAILSIPVIVFAWFAFRSRGGVRLAFAAADLVAIAFLFLTRSRTSILAVLVAFLFSFLIIILRDHRKNLLRWGAIGLLLTGLAGVTGLVASLSPTGINPLSLVRSDRDEGDPTTLTGRVDLWKTCLDYVADRPLLGYGFGGFWSARHIETISEEQKWPINQSHSAYIDQLLALGYPGAILHVALLAGCLLICTARFFSRQDEFGAWAALVVFIAVNSLAEAISLPPGFLSVVLSLITIQLAIIKPDALPGSPKRNTRRAESIAPKKVPVLNRTSFNNMIPEIRNRGL